MAIFINGKACLNLPEQVQAITEDNEAIHKSITNDEASISANTQKISDNTADIEALKTKTDKMVDTNTEQQITAQKTFTQGIKTNKVTNVNGYDDMNDDGTNLTLGNSSRVLNLNGSQARPKYGGKDLAFLTDATTFDISTIANCVAPYQFNDAEFIVNTNADTVVTLPSGAAKYATDLTGMYSDIRLKHEYTGDIISRPVKLDADAFGNGTKNCKSMFSDSEINNVLYLPTMHLGDDSSRMFDHTQFTKILLEDGATVTFDGLNAEYFFGHSPNLVEIGAFDASNWVIIYPFPGSPNVKSIHIKHWKRSFRISDSTAFEEADLVEIISNLDVVTSTQTVNMGATNLAKLTNAEILVATGKGWVLA